MQRLRLKLMTLAVVMLSLAPILWESGIGSTDEANRRANRRSMITSTIHVLILVPVFFATMKNELCLGPIETEMTLHLTFAVSAPNRACCRDLVRLSMWRDLDT